MAPRTPKDPDKKPAKVKPEGRPAAKAVAKPALKVVEKPAPGQAPGQAPVKAAAKVAAKAAGFKLKDLVDQVASATGTKKPDAKKAVEATLAAIAAALKSGSDLALPPLGKLRIARTTGAVLTLKLRTGAGEKAAAKPLADSGEDD
ncbi:MAG TPA: HU family DNA-binding protein [Tabrizicola sp.]|nr:HU family DNA-binding protein [Tabrizicola sp.]